MDRQIPTWRTTTAAIMASPEFELGLDDARKGVPFDWAPVNMPLRIGRRLNKGAIALYRAARARDLII
jgi:hypothetical protein